MYAIFPTQLLAQAAADAIYAIFDLTSSDKVAGTGTPTSPQITKAWAIPLQRITDNQWVVPVHPTITVLGQQFWTTSAWSATWIPPYLG